jgi:hypothetical protein
VNHGGQREIALARQFHAESGGARLASTLVFPDADLVRLRLLHSLAFARDSTAMSHAEKRGASDRYLVNPIIRWRGREWRLRTDLTRLTREHLNGRNRRISSIAVRPGEGLLSDHIAGAQPWRRELVFLVESECGAVAVGRA